MAREKSSERTRGRKGAKSKSPRRKRQSAEEFMNELSKDPAYLARIKERDERIAAYHAQGDAEELLIAKEAKALGFKIKSVWDFINNTPHPFLKREFIGPYEGAYPMLVRHLRVPHYRPVREGIIRALTVKDGGEAVWSALLFEFQKEPDAGLKWVLANALRTAMPYRLRRKHPEIAEAWKAPLHRK